MYKEEIKELIDDLTAWTSTLTSSQHKDVRARTIINDACSYLRTADRYMHRPVLIEIRRALSCMRGTSNRRKFMHAVRDLVGQNQPLRKCDPSEMRSGDVFMMSSTVGDAYKVVAVYEDRYTYRLHKRQSRHPIHASGRSHRMYATMGHQFSINGSFVYILKDSEKVTGPVGFEEIRSAVNDPTTTYDRLAALLSWYEGDMPAQAVVEYVKGNMGFVPVVCWSNGVTDPLFGGFVNNDMPSQPWVAAHTCVGGQRVPAYDFTNSSLFEDLNWLTQRVLMDYIRIPMIEMAWKPFYAEQDHQSAHDTSDHLWSALQVIEEWIDDGCPGNDLAEVEGRAYPARSGDWGGFHSGISALGAATIIGPQKTIHAAATTMARLEVTDGYDMMLPRVKRYGVVFNHWLDHFNRLVLEQVLRLHAKTKGGKS